MQIGIVGLGRMGANMARRLMRKQHEVVVYDLKKESVAALAKEGALEPQILRIWPRSSRSHGLFG